MDKMEILFELIDPLKFLIYAIGAYAISCAFNEFF